MKADLIKIGNSQGLRIPKPLLEQCGFGKSVQITVQNNRLIISPLEEVRQNWGQSFQQMTQYGHDTPIWQETEANTFDQEEWDW